MLLLLLTEVLAACKFALYQGIGLIQLCASRGIMRKDKRQRNAYKRPNRYVLLRSSKRDRVAMHIWLARL